MMEKTFEVAIVSRPEHARLNFEVSPATMSLAEAARVLGIHRSTAWALYKRGELPVPVLRVGSSLRIVRAHVQQYLETGEKVTFSPSGPMSIAS
jgi:excisionase family DNA binding protein